MPDIVVGDTVEVEVYDDERDDVIWVLCRVIQVRRDKRLQVQVVDAPAGFENWKDCTLAGYLKPDDEGVEWCRPGTRDTSRAEADKTTRLRARWKRWVLHRFEDNAIQGTDLFVLPLLSCE